jgi:hypothetical protein
VTPTVAWLPTPDVTSVVLHPATGTEPRGYVEPPLTPVTDTLGATESILNGPALTASASLPALSLRVPEEMETLLAFWVSDLVNAYGEASLLARPDVASEALKPACCVPVHQLLSPVASVPAPRHLSEDAVGVITGLVASRLIVTLTGLASRPRS